MASVDTRPKATIVQTARPILASYLFLAAAFETLILSALTPLLPALRVDLHLSKGQAGWLVGAYAVAFVVTGIPLGFLALRLGIRRSLVAAMALFTITTFGFAFANSFTTLLAIRFLQGAAGALSWSAALAWIVGATDRSRRTGAIALLSGATAAGNMIGPGLGAIASVVGRWQLFSAVALLAAALAGSAFLFTAPDQVPAQPTTTRFSGLLRSTDLIAQMWLVIVPALLLGLTSVLVPLQFGRLGWGPVGIGTTFLVAAGLSVLTRPFLGRWADARGLEPTITVLLLSTAPLVLLIPWIKSPVLLSFWIIAAIVSFGSLFSPAIALLSHSYDHHGVAQILGLAFVNVVSGIGLVVGSAGGGELASATSDAIPYTVCAALCGISVALTRGRGRPATSDRAHLVTETEIRIKNVVKSARR